MRGWRPAYTLRFVETNTVLGRKDTPAGHRIAVVVDDAVQGVTLVTRGEDLAFARPLHERLQILLVSLIKNSLSDGITLLTCRLFTLGVADDGEPPYAGNP